MKRRAPADVSVANSSDEALAKLNTKPNLILLDINMPGMDGLELCKVIRNHIICPYRLINALLVKNLIGIRGQKFDDVKFSPGKVVFLCSGLAIFGCYRFQKHILPDSNEVWLTQQTTARSSSILHI